MVVGQGEAGGKREIRVCSLKEEAEREWQAERRLLGSRGLGTGRNLPRVAQQMRTEEGQKVGCCLWPDPCLLTPWTRGHWFQGSDHRCSRAYKRRVTARRLDILGGFLEEAEVGAGSTMSR